MSLIRSQQDHDAAIKLATEKRISYSQAAVELERARLESRLSALKVERDRAEQCDDKPLRKRYLKALDREKQALEKAERILDRIEEEVKQSDQLPEYHGWPVSPGQHNKRGAPFMQVKQQEDELLREKLKGTT